MRRGMSTLERSYQCSSFSKTCTHTHTQIHHSLVVRFGADHLTSQDLSCLLGVMVPHPTESRGQHQMVSWDLKFSTLWHQLCLPFQGQESQISPCLPYLELQLHPATCHLHRGAGNAIPVWAGCQDPSGNFPCKRTRRLGTKGRGQRQRAGRVSTGWGPGRGERGEQKNRLGQQTCRHQEVERTSQGKQFSRLTCQQACHLGVNIAVILKSTTTRSWAKGITIQNASAVILTNANACTLSASWRSAVTLPPDKQTTQSLWPPLPSPTSFPSLHHHTSTEEGRTWPTLPVVPKPWLSPSWGLLFLQVLWTALDIFFFLPIS